MTTLTLDIPDELLAALHLAGRERRLPEAAVAVEVLKAALLEQAQVGGPAAWLETWRGRLKGREATDSDDPRLRHLLDKHLR